MHCAITVVPISPLPPSTQPHPLPQAIPHHCSCPWIIHISSLATPFPILYFASLWPFCNYLFVLLNPLTSSPIPLYPLPSGNHQNALHIYDSVSVLLVCLFYSYFYKLFLWVYNFNLTVAFSSILNILFSLL